MRTQVPTVGDTSYTVREVAVMYGKKKGTVYSWIYRGILARDGKTVRLQAPRIGGRRAITPESLQAFFEAIDDTQVVLLAEQIEEQERAHKEAAKRLKEKWGIGKG